MSSSDSFLEDFEEVEIIHQDLYTAASIGNGNKVRNILTITDLKHGNGRAVLEKANSLGWTALMYAAYYKHIDIIRYILSLPFSSSLASQVNKRGHNAVMLATFCGANDAIKELEGQFKDAVDNRGRNCVHLAVQFDHVDTIDVLIAIGASINVVDSERFFTPLMCAVFNGLSQMCEKLIGVGADVSIVCPSGKYKGYTALKLAETLQKLNIVELLSAAERRQSLRVTSGLPNIADAPLMYKSMFPNRTSSVSTVITSPDVIDPNAKRVSVFTSYCSACGAHVPSNVHEFLLSIDLEKYYQNFDSNKINIPKLPTLREEDMKNIGITKIGPKKKIISEIKKILNSGCRHCLSADAQIVNKINQLSTTDDNSQLLELLKKIHGRLSDTIYNLNTILDKSLPNNKDQFTDVVRSLKEIEHDISKRCSNVASVTVTGH